MTSQNTFLNFSVLNTIYLKGMMKYLHSPNLVEIGSWGPKIWPYEYLISPIEISVNWPGNFPNSYKPGQFTLHSMGLIRYWCGHISGHHEPIQKQIGEGFFFYHVLLTYGHESAEMQKRKFDDVTLRYSIEYIVTWIQQRRIFNFVALQEIGLLFCVHINFVFIGFRILP